MLVETPAPECVQIHGLTLGVSYEKEVQVRLQENQDSVIASDAWCTIVALGLLCWDIELSVGKGIKKYLNLLNRGLSDLNMGVCYMGACRG